MNLPAQEVPQGYKCHAEFLAEELRDELRGVLDNFIPEVEQVEVILDQVTQLAYDVQSACLGDKYDDFLNQHMDDDLNYGDYDDEPSDGYIGCGFDAEGLASAGWGTDEDYGYYGDDW